MQVVFWSGFIMGVVVSAVGAGIGLWMGLRNYARDWNQLVEDIEGGDEAAPS